MKVVKEGEHEDHFWETSSITAHEQVGAFVPSDETVPEDNIPSNLFTSGNHLRTLPKFAIKGSKWTVFLDPGVCVLKGLIDLKKRTLCMCCITSGLQ